MIKTNIAFEISADNCSYVFDKLSDLNYELYGKIYLLTYFMPAGIEKTLFPGKDGPSISRINVGEVMAYDLLRENSFLSPSDMTYILLEDYLPEDATLYWRGFRSGTDKDFEFINLKRRRDIDFSGRCLEYIKRNPRASLKDVLADIKR
ncbi:hypothetical protein [Candidatus Proelusimicrobium volucris]|uniref:hypothetical protein n=1 Tax=Candidatus Proelusimicrobium volucris TaxID=3416225 RepID=UPI003D13E756